MEQSEFVEVGFAPTYENQAYSSNEVAEVPTSNGSAKTEPAVSSSTASPGEDKEQGIVRGRPYSASMISRKSMASTRSKASLSPTMYTSEYAINKFQSYKEGSFAKAVEECKRVAMNEQDGEYKGSWLLTEISYWNLEQEKIVILTSETVILIKFDFITLTIKLIKKLSIKEIVKLQIADLAFPSVSLVPGHDQGGVRIHMGSPTFLQRWNPLSDTLPVVTFTHHPTIYNKNEVETIIYNADDFAESLMGEAEKVLGREGREVVMDESPILIETYAGIFSVIYNQSKLGFNMDRGGVKY